MAWNCPCIIYSVLEVLQAILAQENLTGISNLKRRIKELGDLKKNLKEFIVQKNSSSGKFDFSFGKKDKNLILKEDTKTALLTLKKDLHKAVQKLEQDLQN